MSGKTFPAINPATGETICEVAECEAVLGHYTELKTVTLKLG